jgi:hypothetical protein
MDVTSVVTVQVSDPTHVADARRHATQIGRVLGFDETADNRLAQVVTEAAAYLIDRAGGGEILVGPAGGGLFRGVQVLALDRSGLIRHVPARPGAGSASASDDRGLGAIVRSATSFDIYVQPARGSVLAATVYSNDEPATPAAGVCVASPRETYCGDGWAIWSAGDLTSIFLSDGLGRGREAAEATSLAVEAFREHLDGSAADVIHHVCQALRRTRGAAVAMARLDRREGRVHFCGLGNIAAVIQRPEGPDQHLISQNGIAGHTMRRLMEYTYSWPPASLIVLHSEGIGSHWSLARYAGLSKHRPDVIAGVLYRDFRRNGEDATVVVARRDEEARSPRSDA